MDSGFYSKQLNDSKTKYNSNYNDAIKKLNELLNYLKTIRISFVVPSGDIIEKIRTDIDKLCEDVDNEITKLNNAYNNTLKRAASSDMVITLANNQHDSTFRDSRYVWELKESKTYIESNGKIYRKSTWKKIPCESYDSLFGITAGIIKAFGGFETVNTTSYADLEAMMNGKLTWLPDLKNNK